MDPAPPDQPPTSDYTALRKAPDHIAALILDLLRQPRHGPASPAAAMANARTELEQARNLADRIWAEAAHTGAVWGMSRNPEPIQIVLPADRMSLPAEWAMQVAPPPDGIGDLTVADPGATT